MPAGQGVELLLFYCTHEQDAIFHFVFAISDFALFHSPPSGNPLPGFHGCRWIGMKGIQISRPGYLCHRHVLEVSSGKIQLLC